MNPEEKNNVFRKEKHQQKNKHLLFGRMVLCSVFY